MAGKWREMPFSEAVIVNPSIRLERGMTYPFVDMASVNAGSRGVVASEQREFTGGGSRFQKGDTLMARITPCLENGKIARFISHDRADVAHGSTEFIVIRGRPEVTDTDFAYYLTQWEEVRSYAISHMTGTSGRQRVPTDSLNNLIVPVPPLPVQRRIAHILGTLDDKIELNRRMNETLEAMARAVFKSWFVDAVEHGLPKGWREGTLRNCCDRVENGGTPHREESSYWEPPTIPWLTSGEVRQPIVTETKQLISQAGLANSSAKLWPIGTTIVAMYGATASQVCFLSTIMSANQACCGLVPLENMRYYTLLLASSSVSQLENQARGSAQQNLSQQIVADFPAIIPDEKILARFDKLAHPIFQRWIMNLNQSRTLVALRDALLPKLVGGEIGA